MHYEVEKGPRGPMGAIGPSSGTPGKVGEIENVLHGLERDCKAHYIDSDGNHWCGLTDYAAQSMVEKLLEYKWLAEQGLMQDRDCGDLRVDLTAEQREGIWKIQGSIHPVQIAEQMPSGDILLEQWQQGKGERGV